MSEPKTRARRTALIGAENGVHWFVSPPEGVAPAWDIARSTPEFLAGWVARRFADGARLRRSLPIVVVGPAGPMTDWDTKASPDSKKSARQIVDRAPVSYFDFSVDSLLVGDRELRAVSCTSDVMSDVDRLSEANVVVIPDYIMSQGARLGRAAKAFVDVRTTAARERVPAGVEHSVSDNNQLSGMSQVSAMSHTAWDGADRGPLDGALTWIGLPNHPESSGLLFGSTAGPIGVPIATLLLPRNDLCAAPAVDLRRDRDCAGCRDARWRQSRRRGRPPFHVRQQACVAGARSNLEDGESHGPSQVARARWIGGRQESPFGTCRASRVRPAGGV